jgi:hypothetical protein
MLPGPRGVVQPRQLEPTRLPHLDRPPTRKYEYTRTNTVPDRLDFTVVTDSGITTSCFIANDQHATTNR